MNNVVSKLCSDNELGKWFKYTFHRWRATHDYDTDDIPTMVEILKRNFGFDNDTIMRFANATHTLNGFVY